MPEKTNRNEDWNCRDDWFMNPTGRTFIYDDLNAKAVSAIPDHDEWTRWLEYADAEDGSLVYESEEGDYTLTADEFHVEDWTVRPLADVLEEYMFNVRAERVRRAAEELEPGAGRSALTGEECC